MTKTNVDRDAVILELSKKIKEKKEKIEKGEKFSPVTNCSLEFSGVRYNLNVLTKEQIVGLLVQLNVFKNSAKELGLLNEYVISGYQVENWIEDLNSRYNYLNRKAEQDKLKVLESQLDALLSNEAKIDRQLQEIMKQIG